MWHRLIQLALLLLLLLLLSLLVFLGGWVVCCCFFVVVFLLFSVCVCVCVCVCVYVCVLFLLFRRFTFFFFGGGGGGAGDGASPNLTSCIYLLALVFLYLNNIRNSTMFFPVWETRLTFTTLWAYSSENILMISFIFFQTTGKYKKIFTNFVC